MVSALISRIVILIFGTLYPAYASYKAVRTKNVKEYVKWMMYWIVFALFTSFETFSDCLLSWLPFYYEIKIVFVLWLLSPVTKGSSFLYRKFVHPQLTKREKEIDEYIMHAKDAGYSTVLRLGSRGISYATNVIVKTAIQGQSRLVNHIRRSYSMSDLSDDYVDQPRSRDRSGSIPESEDDFDNRLLEDNKELESRKKDHDPLYVPEDNKEELISTRQIYPTNSASTRLRTGTAYRNRERENEEEEKVEVERRNEEEEEKGEVETRNEAEEGEEERRNEAEKGEEERRNEAEKGEGETRNEAEKDEVERLNNRARHYARQTKSKRKRQLMRTCARKGYISSRGTL